jgi:hypothetical protein
VVPGLGQIVVALAAVVCWYLVSGVRARWFLAGAALWAVAVALKVLCARQIDKPVIEFLHAHLPSYPVFVTCGGLFTGVESSLFEMGVTMLGVLIWPSLGHGAGRAIAIGVGAGAIEALLLGIYSLVVGLGKFAGSNGPPTPKEKIAIEENATPLFWLVAPVERTIAILCHASSRAMVLLGAVYGNCDMIFWGVVLFALLDGVAGAAHISGKLETISLWWIELALSPFALASVPILMWCYEKYAL